MKHSSPQPLTEKSFFGSYVQLAHLVLINSRTMLNYFHTALTKWAKKQEARALKREASVERECEEEARSLHVSASLRKACERPALLKQM